MLIKKRWGVITKARNRNGSDKYSVCLKVIAQIIGQTESEKHTRGADVLSVPSLAQSLLIMSDQLTLW